MHNGIMIGIETLLNDDPMLNGSSRACFLKSSVFLGLGGTSAPHTDSFISLFGPIAARDVPPLLSGQPHPQPTPIILDARARFPLSSALFRNFKEGKGKRPWIVCDSTMCRADRRIELEEAGCRILVMPTKGTGAFLTARVARSPKI